MTNSEFFAVFWWGYGAAMFVTGNYMVAALILTLAVVTTAWAMGVRVGMKRDDGRRCR